MTELQQVYVFTMGGLVGFMLITWSIFSLIGRPSKERVIRALALILLGAGPIYAITTKARPHYHVTCRREPSWLPESYCFEVGDGSLFAFAGLWDRWRTPDGQVVETCTILTTAPNELLADVHDRMPVILAPEHYDRWLDPAMQDVASAVGLLKPFDAGLMKRFPVNCFW